MRVDGPGGRAREAEARLAEAVTLGRRVEEAEYRLADYAEALADVAEALPDEIVREEIECGLGVVEVDGTGRLLDIRLNTKALATSNAAVFADRVLAALHQAEEQAHGAQMERIRRAARLALSEDFY